LRDQICRSAVSIASNIAEGDERDTDREATRFFYIAKGSLAELRTQLQIACEADVLDKELYDAMESESEAVGRMLGSLIKIRRRAELPQR
jgi:four helix bundle protein